MPDNYTDAQQRGNPAEGTSGEPGRHSVKIDAHAAPHSHQNITGSGDINSNQHYHVGYAWVRSEEITPNQMAEAEHAFVPPPGYEDAWTRLNNQKILIISAPEGTGKRTTALNLLGELREPRPHRADAQRRPMLRLRELSEDWETPRVSQLPPYPDHAFLLDLSHSSDQLPDADFGSRLVDYAEDLGAVQSFLIVLTTPEVWEACAVSTRSMTVPKLGQPAAHAIIKARLTAPSSTCPQREAWLTLPEFRLVLDHGLSPRDAVGLHQMITASEDSGEGRANVIDQFHGWRNYLSAWWKRDGSYERAMQIVAATVGRAFPGDILTLTDNFLEISGHTAETHLPLAGPDLSERLHRAGLQPVDPDHVELEPARPRFHDAVLDHVWKERPQIHAAYLEWIGQATASKTAGQKYVEQIATAVTGMGVRRNSTEFLGLIETWAKEGAHQEKLTTSMLKRTCLHPLVGARVRTKLRTWTEGKTTPPHLIDVVIDVCAGELGYERTVVALLRLKKILLRENASQFSAKAASAIVEIARHPDRLDEVISEVTRWMDDPHPTPGRVGFLALMAVGEQGLTTHLLERCANGDNELAGRLTDSWRKLVNSGPEDQSVLAAIRSLLAYANTRPELIDTVVGILAPAVQGDFKRTIAGKIVINTPVEVQQGGFESAHEKILGLLFDTPEPSAQHIDTGYSPDTPEQVDDGNESKASAYVPDPEQVDVSHDQTSASYPDVSNDTPDSPVKHSASGEADEGRRFGRFWR